MEPNINPILLEKCMLKKIRQTYNGHCDSLIGVSDIKILQTPFRTVQIFNVFQNVLFVKNLAKEIRKIKLEEKVNDLFRLQQSSDLNNLILGSWVKKFVSVMQTKMLKAFNKIFGVKLKTAISMTVSKYGEGDYLLCHDDKCESRHLAFVLYLSDTNWEIEDGGLLTLFNHDEETMQPTTEEVQLLPTFNSMVLFEVNTTTYHEVTEVCGNKVRWSINGWFHSDEALNIPNLDYHYISGQVVSVEGQNVKYDNIINNNYLKAKMIKNICSAFKKNKSVSMSTFLENKFYHSCLKELKSNIEWEEVGPVNHRKYFTAADFSLDEPDRYLPPNICFLVSVFCSPNFADYISSITKKRLVKPDGSRNPLNIEIQRWTKGCYTLLADNDVFQALNFIDVVLFFTLDSVLSGKNDGGGVLTYINDLDEGRVLTPEPNGLIISDFDENTKKFTHYIDYKTHNKEYYAIALSFLAENITSD